jgi:hypothetical protein
MKKKRNIHGLKNHANVPTCLCGILGVLNRESVKFSWGSRGECNLGRKNYPDNHLQ